MAKGKPNNPKACQLCGLQYLPHNNKQKVCKPCQPEYDRQFADWVYKLYKRENNVQKEE